LESLGYQVDGAVLSANKLGWAQTRKRYFLVATRRSPAIGLSALENELRHDPLPVSWAIGDLERRPLSDSSVMDSVPNLSQENRERIEWLYEHDAFDLPNEIRPDCHKDGHTYPAVYGRMHWDQPAGTITGGFLTPGRGRFIHPRQPRVLTPREAARIQCFPDRFDFTPPTQTNPSRASVTKWIGDAVPPILGFAAGITALSSL
jgi:DNA (cytosine-5)-methyltransferase 1